MDPPPPDWLSTLAARVPPWARRPPVLVAALAGAVAVVAVVAFGAVALARAGSGPAPRLTLPVAGATPGPPGAPGETGGPPSPTSPGGPGGSPGGMLTVHAAGAVGNPGIYTLPPGARVGDAVVAAGGARPEADLDRLNLAAKLADGDRVYVPRHGEAAPPGGLPGGPAGAGATTTTSTAPIDLNAATADQLEALPGIGPATAQAIVTYRARHGRFRSVTELLEVPGIGPAKLEALRPLVRV